MILNWTARRAKTQACVCSAWSFLVRHLGRDVASSMVRRPSSGVPATLVCYPGIPLPMGVG